MRAVDQKESFTEQRGEMLLRDGQLGQVSTIAAKRTGRKPSPSTIWRWVNEGLQGGRIRLACVFHGGRWMTTDAAFEQFLSDQTAAHTAPTAEPDVTDKALIAEGLL